jgi:hypothetical protein
VAGQIVHDDNVALAQFANKDALDVGFEGVAIDWAVEDERRDHAVRGQASDESRRFPMAMRDADTQPFAASAAAVGPRHLGRSPGPVDEDQAFGIEIELTFELGLAPLQNVGLCIAEGRGFVGERLAQLFNCDVGRFFDKREGSCLCTPRPARTCGLRGERGRASPQSRSSAHHRLTLAALTPNRSPACRWLKPCATAANTRTRRSSDRALGMSAGLHPADSLNHLNRDSGIPFDSIGSVIVLTAIFQEVVHSA